MRRSGALARAVAAVLGLALSLTMSPARAEPTHRVLLLTGPNEGAPLSDSELLTRLRAELSAAGFEVIVVPATSGESPKSQVETAGRELNPAAVVLVRERFASGDAPDPIELDGMLAAAEQGLGDGMGSLLAKMEDGAIQAELQIMASGASALEALTGITTQNDELSATVESGFGDQMSSLMGSATTLFADLAGSHVSRAQETASTGAESMLKIVAGFDEAVAQPTYRGASRSWLARGACEMRAQRWEQAQQSLSRGFELDPGNPAIAYNLAEVLLRRGEAERARFYAARVNAEATQVTAQSLWLAARIEHKLGNRAGTAEWGQRLLREHPQSAEARAFNSGRFEP